MITLTKRYEFSAIHKLWNDALSAEENQAYFGKCTEDHPHTYTLELTLAGVPHPQTGMIMNIFDMDKLVAEYILQWVEGKNLAEEVPFFKGQVVTAETQARIFYERLSPNLPEGILIKRVRVFESSEFWADYTANIPTIATETTQTTAAYA